MAPKQRILWRGLTVLHAGLQSVAAMFSQHSTKAKQNFPMNACMCSTNNKNKEQTLFFFCQLWIRKEVWNNWATLKDPLPQRNSHGQLLLYLRKNNLTSRLVYGGQKIWQKKGIFHSCNWGLCHVAPNTRTLVILAEVNIHTWSFEGSVDLLGPNSYFVFFQDRSSKSFENSTIKERQDGSRSWVYMAPESLEVFYFPVAYGACFFPQLGWFIYELTACCFCWCTICLPWI